VIALASPVDAFASAANGKPGPVFASAPTRWGLAGPVIPFASRALVKAPPRLGTASAAVTEAGFGIAWAGQVHAIAASVIGEASAGVAGGDAAWQRHPAADPFHATRCFANRSGSVGAMGVEVGARGGDGGTVGWVPCFVGSARGGAGTPAGVRGLERGRFRWCRFARPPATGWHPSGMREGP